MHTHGQSGLKLEADETMRSLQTFALSAHLRREGAHLQIKQQSVRVFACVLHIHITGTHTSGLGIIFL